MKRKKYTNKLLVLGIDALDPSLTKKYVESGIMPNTKKFLEHGTTTTDYILLGNHPTITPPMWTTLATGAYPATHGIIDYWLPDGNNLDTLTYGIDSERCKAEQIWNVTAEAGLKTLVWHWPGSSWPPSSDNPNLHVVDGTQPGGVNHGTGIIEKDFVLIADVQTEDTLYKANAMASAHIPCTIEGLTKEEKEHKSLEGVLKFAGVGLPPLHNIILSPEDGEGTMGSTPMDIVLSPIKPATSWKNAPEDAKEFVMLCSQGLIHRNCLIEKNKDGIYDTVKVYKNKKSDTPIAVLTKNQFVNRIKDESIRDDKKYNIERSMRILDLSEDGTHLKLWASSAMDINEKDLFYPKSLYDEVYERFGPAIPGCMLGGYDEQILKECMIPQWDAIGEWQANALNYFMDSDRYDVIFSHHHNVDLEGHMFVKFMNGKEENSLPKEVYAEVCEMVYKQTDDYIGRFLKYLDQGWTILIVSDHGQACAEYLPIPLGEPSGVSVRLLDELGYTKVKKDKDGNELHEIDWNNTKAIAKGSNSIYLNIKGRNPHGIVDPKDQYELEEQIMTDLYGYRHPISGKRVISLALRNRDAMVLGLGGPNCADIICFTAEGYHFDHGNCLSTTKGYADTSVSAIFMAAGPGIKENHITQRVLRQVDIAPTVASLLGTRMPAQCEGAPAYQIFDSEF